VTKYWHLKKGSVAVKVGARVACGALLGFVGSSGESASPHLHFGVEGKDGATIDPFAGPRSQPLSYWTLQVGPLGWPGDRCAGVAYPEARPDGGSVARDAGPAADGGGAHSAVGCALAPGPEARGGAWPPLVLLVLASLSARRSGGARRRSRSSRQ
jgi:hypothetical protein